MINRERLLERFLRYVQVDTTAVNDAAHYPSSPGQLELGAAIVKELDALGLPDATQSEHGIVTATVAGTTPHDAPVVALNAHLDTSPETTGAGVKPQVLRDYAGGDIVLPRGDGKMISVAENPELNDLLGATLITTDGTTLLGGDDKAGVAVIMEVAECLLENSKLVHCPVRVLFTCDEEIGRGTDFVDLESLGATVAYTLDGPSRDHLDVETFSADLADIRIRGINIHPAIAKGRMVNAIRAASSFVDQLPRDMLCPEVTEGREGFLHPYHFSGGVDEVRLCVILRDFETSGLASQAETLRGIAANVERAFEGCAVEIDIRAQYRNMREGLERDPRAVKYAELAHERLGRAVQKTIIRGGTDGSRFTEKGLPTPNLSTGQHNLHSPLEWACLDEMVAAAEVLLELVQVWGDPPSDASR